MSIFTRLWPWARKAVTIQVRADVHNDLVRAMRFLNDGDVIGALDAIGDFIAEDALMQSHAGGVRGLLHSVESSLRTAASELEMSYK